MALLLASLTVSFSFAASGIRMTDAFNKLCKGEPSAAASGGPKVMDA
jgi:hypothetical protein